MAASRTRSRCSRWSLVVVAGLLNGCQAAFWQDRLVDLTEVADLTVTTGVGMGFSARCSNFLQVGAGSFDGTAHGLVEGRLVQVREQRSEFGLSMFHFYEYRRRAEGRLLEIRHPRFGDPGYQERFFSSELLADRWYFDLGLSAHLVFLGGNAAFHLEEFLDFLAGWVGYDLLRDDVYSPLLADLRRQALDNRTPRFRAAAFDAMLRRGEPIHGFGIYTASDAMPEFQRVALERLRETVQQDEVLASPESPPAP